MGTFYAFLGTAIFGIVAWAFRLESKVGLGDQKIIALKELIQANLASIDRRLERIEASINGHLSKE